MIIRDRYGSNLISYHLVHFDRAEIDAPEPARWFGIVRVSLESVYCVRRRIDVDLALVSRGLVPNHDRVLHESTAETTHGTTWIRTSFLLARSLDRSRVLTHDSCHVGLVQSLQSWHSKEL